MLAKKQIYFSFLIMVLFSLSDSLIKAFERESQYSEIKIGNTQVEEKLKSALTEHNIYFFVNKEGNVTIREHDLDVVGPIFSQIMEKILPIGKSVGVDKDIYGNLIIELKKQKINYHTVDVYDSDFIIIDKNEDVKNVNKLIDKLTIKALKKQLVEEESNPIETK